MPKNDKGTTVSARLLFQILDETPSGQAEFARALDVDPQVVNNWRRRGVPKGRLTQIAPLIGMTAEEYEANANAERQVPVGRIALRQIVNYDQNKLPTPATFSIPLYDIGGIMGDKGRVRPEMETVVGNIEINQQWVRSHLPNISSPNNLRVITGFGDSMEDTYHDGDILFIDMAITDIRLDAVYVFAMGDHIYIKRLQRRPDGSLAILSDNKKYDPYVVQHPEKTDMKVLGRVVWAWNGRKL